MIKHGYEENKNWITMKFNGDDHNENFWRKRFHYPLSFSLTRKN